MQIYTGTYISEASKCLFFWPTDKSIIHTHTSMKAQIVLLFSLVVVLVGVDAGGRREEGVGGGG